MTGFVHTSHTHDGELAVFLIGMRVNQPWRPDLWVPVFTAMPGMIAELYTAKAAAARGEGPDLGFLEARTLVGAGGPTIVQYWATSSPSTPTRTTRNDNTGRHGRRSTGAAARPPTPSASGTRRMPCRPAHTRASTSVCRRPGSARPSGSPRTAA